MQLEDKSFPGSLARWPPLPGVTLASLGVFALVLSVVTISAQIPPPQWQVLCIVLFGISGLVVELWAISSDADRRDREAREDRRAHDNRLAATLEAFGGLQGMLTTSLEATISKLTVIDEHDRQALAVETYQMVVDISSAIIPIRQKMLDRATDALRGDSPTLSAAEKGEVMTGHIAAQFEKYSELSRESVAVYDLTFVHRVLLLVRKYLTYGIDLTELTMRANSPETLADIDLILKDLHALPARLPHA